MNSHKKTEKKSPMAILCLGLVLVLLFVQVLVSNRLTNLGKKIAHTEEEIQSLREENAQLAEKEASASSLLTLKDKAEKIGFTIAITPLYLSHNLPVAFDLR